MRSLNGRSGDQKRDRLAAARFHSTLLSDPRVSRLLEGLGVEGKPVLEEALLRMASSPPPGPGGSDLEGGQQGEEAAERGLTEHEIDAVIDILGETLAERHAPESDSKPDAG